MSESVLSMLIVGAEFGAMAILILLVLGFFVLRRRRANKQHVAEFISSYKKDRSERIDNFKERLEGNFYLVGEDADEALNKISNSESRLHKRVLNMYLGNDRDCLKDIRKDVASLNENWMSIMNDSLANASESLGKTEVITQMQKEYSELKQENESMRKELAEAMQSMEEMLKEYSLLYAGRDEKNETMERLSGEFDEMKKKTDSQDTD
ncbi:EGFR-like transmembrane domain-containing protein [Sulfuriflexus mobilis]|uniref:EGFR-like transmembrane domain-containing protein n=1 Tax=Sulfuriflexus mobilis TaxID=1811807 RepID=UPI000F83DAFD|nr:transmembrane domain-containing protein [Sulfuriflexus mobilis]